MTFPSGLGVYSPKIRDSSVVRKFVSQHGSGYLGLMIYDGQSPVDPVVNSVSLKVWYHNGEEGEGDPRGELVLSVDDHTGTETIQKESTGRFFYNIGPQHTQNRGVLTAEWSYEVNDKDFTYIDYLQILDQMPVYDSLNDQAKYVIENVSWLFGDLFDSTEGGPWLQENFQTKWGYERLAHLMETAIGRINLTGQPPTNYSTRPGSKSLPADWTPLLIWSLRLEVIRHLMRSYTEQPEFRNMDVTYTDRRDYAQRWKMILDDEKPELEKAITVAKRSLLSLSRGSLIVAGGLFSTTGFFKNGWMVGAQRSMRFYPAAPSVSWGLRGR